VDVHAKLDELTALVENARAMPMSASCVVNRGEVLAHIDEVRQLLPSEIANAERVLRDKRAVVEEGRAVAEELLESARTERARMLSRTEVMREATREAQQIVAAAEADSERMRREIDDYVDGKLANFEVVLHKTMAAVAKGRAKISGRTGLEGLGPGPDEGPLPQ
jgi:cell division septum initiation protein DivIVA